MPKHLLNIKTEQGEIFGGNTKKEIVRKMSLKSFIAETKTDYMEDVRERLKIVYDIKIRFEKGDYAAFLDQLAKHNFISYF